MERIINVVTYFNKMENKNKDKDKESKEKYVEKTESRMKVPSEEQQTLKNFIETLRFNAFNFINWKVNARE